MGKTSPPRRILIVRLSAVGDVVNTLPVISAVRRGVPDAFIGFAVEDKALPLIQGHPHVDRIHVFPRKKWRVWRRNPLFWGRLFREFGRFMMDFRRARYDVALDLQGNIKGALHGLLSGARLRVGFARGHCKELNHFFSHLRVRPPGLLIHRVDKFLRQVAAIGIPTPDPSYALPDSPPSREWAEGFRKKHGLAERGYAVIHPGTSPRQSFKRWYPARFGELAKRVAGRYRIPPVVTWGPGEEEMAREVVEASDGRAILSNRTTSILDLVEVLRHARLFVGSDSAPLHLASALDVPSVALFGRPKHPKISGPRSARSRAVFKPGPNGECGPIEDILVDDVWDAVLEVMA